MKLKSIILLLVIVLISMPSNLAENNTFYTNEAEELTLHVDALDPDKEDILAYYFTSPFNENGSWTPGYEDSGEYTVEVRVSDGEDYDSTNVTIIVHDTDRAPIIIATGKKYVNEGQQIIVEIEAFDPDGDSVEFSAVDIPEDSELNNTILTWTPNFDVVQKSWIVKVLNFYHLDFLNDDKKIEVVISAKGQSLASNGIIPIIVRNVNRAPSINEMEDIIIQETDTVYLEPSAHDLDEDYLRYFYSGWSNKNKIKTGYEDEGNYSVTILASDGLLSNSTTINIIVENKNRYPNLEDIKRIHIKENQTLNIQLKGNDEDNDTLIFMVSNPQESPADSSFENNTFTWTPDFNTVEAEDITKDFKINFTVWDGENSDTKTANIKVFHVNQAPYLTKFSPQEIRQEIWVGEDIIFSLNASDLDGENITYKWNFGFINRKIDSPIIRRVFNRPGVKMVTGIATDGIQEVKQSWLITVKEPVKVKTETIKEPYQGYTGEYYHFEIQHPDVIKESVEDDEKPWYYKFIIY